MTSASDIKKICDLGMTLHRSGCAPYKIEKYIQYYAHEIDVAVVVQATPMAITYQFPDHDNQMIMNRVAPASVDLSMLAHTIKRISDAVAGAPKAPGGFHPLLFMLAFVSIPPSYLTLVGSSLMAIGLSAGLGFLVWVCQMICQQGRANFVEFLSALITGLAVACISTHGIDVPVWGLCIAAIVLHIPGLYLANALECFAFNDILSGTTLIGQAAFIYLKLFIGIYIGLSIGQTIWGEAVSIPNTNEVPGWMPLVALPVLSFSLGIIFNARLVDSLLALPATSLGMWGPFFLDLGSGWVVGTWVTTVCITLYGTWLAKRMNLTGAIYIVPGLVVLAPGSRLLMGASQSLYGETLINSSSVGLSALFIFSAIVAGQITAYSLYSQKNQNLIV